MDHLARSRPRRSARSSRSLGPVATVLGGVVVLYFGRDLLIPLAFAVTLALILAPAVDWLVKAGTNRAFAVLLAVTLTVGAAGSIGYVIFNQLVEAIGELPRYQQNLHKKIESLRVPGKSGLGKAAESVREISKEFTSTAPSAGTTSTPAKAQPKAPQPVQVVAEPISDLQGFRQVIDPILVPVGITGIVLIFAIFLLIEEGDLRNRFFRLAGMDRLNTMTSALDDATRRVSRYLLLQFLVNAILGVLLGLALYALGVPYAALWGAIAAILRVVPYVGAIFSGVLPLIVAIAVFDSWVQPMLVAAIFVTLETVAANFLEPLLYGRHTGISALALLVTSVFWAMIWGPAGLILSTPLTACLVVLGRHLPEFEFLHILLGDEPALKPEAQIYQRLLASDDHSARSLLTQLLGQAPALEVYDSVVIPALTMMERDRRKGALTADREEYLFLAMREILAEVVSEAGGELNGTRRVFCIPANNEADEITAAMLAQVVQQRGTLALSFPATPGIQYLRHLDISENDVFCICSLPPFAITKAYKRIAQLRRSFPKQEMIVGLWGFGGDLKAAAEKLRDSRPGKLAVTLSEALQFIAPQTTEETATPESPAVAG